MSPKGLKASSETHHLCLGMSMRNSVVKQDCSLKMMQKFNTISCHENPRRVSLQHSYTRTYFLKNQKNFYSRESYTDNWR